MNEAKIIRQHKDTWASVDMGDYMFLLCIGAKDASDSNPSVIVVNMETEKIAFQSDSEIIDMIRETTGLGGDVSDDELMYDYAQNEYI